MSIHLYAKNDLVIVGEWYGGAVVEDHGGLVKVVTSRGVEWMLRDRVRRMTDLEIRLWGRA